jgi:hypothetical protein
MDEAAEGLLYETNFFNRGVVGADSGFRPGEASIGRCTYASSALS